jgi:hypothetical protein
MELSPTRHWSVGRHISRKHAGIGEPISINTRQTRTQMIGSGWSYSTATTNPTQISPEPNNLGRKGSSRYYNNYFSNDNDSGSLHQDYPNNFSPGRNNFNSEETRRQSPLFAPQKKDIIDDSLERLRQMSELEKILRQNQWSSGGLPIGAGNIPLQSLGGTPMIALYLMCKYIIDNNRNFGFKGHLCYNCFSYWIDTAYNDKEEGMKSLIFEKSFSHQCDPRKALQIKNCNSQDLENRKSQAFKGLSDLLIPMVSGIALFGQQTIYLNIEELDSIPPSTSAYHSTSSIISSPSQQDGLSLGESKRIDEQEHSSPRIKEEDCINLGELRAIKDNHWTYRAIKEEKGGHKKSIVIDGSELIDFVRTAMATFGTFKAQMEDDGSTRYFFMYFSIGSK